jgi:Saxitoxin biosynthesis operon protein SxtJ
LTLVTVDWRPSEQDLKRFGNACVVVFAALGVWVWWRQSVFGFSVGPQFARDAAGCLWSLAAVCGVLRWVAPRWLRPLYVGLIAAGLPIGFVVSHLAMAAVFLAVVTPTAIVFRALGRDALERNLERDATTYWRRRRPVVDTARYYRQF